MEVENAETCIEMVRNGLGYGIVPRVLLHDDKELHQRNILDEKGNPIIRKTWMIYQEETLRMKLVKEFVNFIKGYGFYNAWGNRPRFFYRMGKFKFTKVLK